MTEVGIDGPENDLTTLVVGGSGATGRLLVAQLLSRGQRVRVIVRTPENVPRNPNLSVIHASLLDLDDAELARHTAGCDAVASCLGHTLSFKGMFGPPRRLVTDATRRLCRAVRAGKPERPVKFVLMNTAGNRNRDLDERISVAERGVIGLLRLLLPPHVDNEEAADYLRTEVGPDDAEIEWVVVRPDNLIDEPQVTPYAAYPSPIRSAIFDAGVTSRINVARFMSELIGNEEVWSTWRGRMPVLYQAEDDAPE